MTTINNDSNDYANFNQVEAPPVSGYSQPETADSVTYSNPIEFHGHTINQLASYSNPVNEVYHNNLPIIFSSNYSTTVPGNLGTEYANVEISTLSPTEYANVGADRVTDAVTSHFQNATATNYSAVYANEMVDQYEESTLTFVDPKKTNENTTAVYANDVVYENEETTLSFARPTEGLAVYANVSPETNDSRANENQNTTGSQLPLTQNKTNMLFERVVYKQQPGEIYSQFKAKVYVTTDKLNTTSAFKDAYVATNIDKQKSKIITVPREGVKLSPTDVKDHENEIRVNEQLYKMSKADGKKFEHVVTVSQVTVMNTGQIGYKGEYAKDGTLENHLNKMSASQKLKVSHMLVDGLAEMHDVGLLHRDIKVDNVVVFLDGNKEVENVKFIDMGKARFNSDPPEDSPTGLFVGLQPPEYYSNRTQRNEPVMMQNGIYSTFEKQHFDAYSKPSIYNEKSDIYQLGSAFYQVHCGVKKEDLLINMKFSPRNPGVWVGMGKLSPEMQSLISDMRNVDPNKRPSLDEVRARLSKMS